MTIATQAKEYLEEQRTKLKPREMVRVVPSRLDVFESLLETPTQPSTIAGATALKDTELFGSMLKPTLNLTVAQHYLNCKEPQQLTISENKDITISQDMVGNRTDTHLLIVVEKGVATNIHLEFDTNTPEGLHDLYIELLVKENAKVNVTTLQNAP